jgi:hypothetical protein
MPIRTLTPEQEAAKVLENKSITDYIKEGKTIEEARALVLATREANKKTTENDPK